jgi:hypothetical protein
MVRLNRKGDDSRRRARFQAGANPVGFLLTPESGRVTQRVGAGKATGPAGSR